MKLARRVSLAVLTVSLATTAHAQISLSLVNTYAKSAPFGVAFDGTNVWWSGSDGVAHEMTLAGVETGNTTAMPNGWSALAWDASRTQLVSKGYFGGVVSWYDRYTAANRVDLPQPGCCLIDGLDIANGQLWFSPDVSYIARYDIGYTGGVPSSLTAPIGGSLFLSGTFSGVARANAYVLTVNDASSPRQLCVYKLDASQVGCQNFVNQRYEDIGFDGRYLWAADYYGNKIDQFDVIGSGGSILVPTPEPSSVALLLTGMLAIGGVVVRRRARG